MMRSEQVEPEVMERSSRAFGVVATGRWQALGARWLFATVFFVTAYSAVAQTDEAEGVVCLGENLAKVSSERSERLYLRIDDSPKIYFSEPYEGPRIVVRDLDVDADHSVKVYFDDEVVQSWKLNFSDLETRAVLIWRVAGAWRMKPIETAACRDDA